MQPEEGQRLERLQGWEWGLRQVQQQVVWGAALGHPVLHWQLVSQRLLSAVVWLEPQACWRPQVLWMLKEWCEVHDGRVVCLHGLLLSLPPEHAIPSILLLP